MSAADRYAALLPRATREEPLLDVPRRVDEHEFQAHWFAGHFGRAFTALDGRSVEIVQFGVWNREAGPDFADAAVSIDGAPPVAGWIELDMDARDWERHGHASNSAYDGVVLHVFTTMPSSGPEIFTRTSSHANVPQVRLDLGAISALPANPVPEAAPGRCSGPLREMPEDKAREILLAAAEHRLKRKAAALARLVQLHGPDEALFQALATTLGYKNNKLPFTLLAQRLPLKLLRHMPDAAASLLFGVAGFLPVQDLGAFEDSTRAYLRSLWENWWALRAEYERLAIPAPLWKLGGQRPVNHPQRRVAALAQMVRNWSKIRALGQRCDPAQISDFFHTLADPYWDLHYTLASKAAPKPMALVGGTRVTDMLANVFLPMAYAADSSRWIGFKNLPATLSNRRAEVAALRLFGADSARATGLMRSAAMQQGLLQVYEDFCQRDASDCANCPFPEQLRQW